MLKIKDAETAAEFDDVRLLCWEYRDFLLRLGPADADIVRAFYPKDKYASIMERLEQEHAPPAGALKLALKDGAPVGCGMYHTLMPGTAEIKRVYVRENARGLGAGRELMLALVAQCRASGFSRIFMDTGVPLEAAQRLYLSMGFKLRGPYQEIPESVRDRLIFFEMYL
ncbi:ribosomal protein S18 acetylase RimI-like enzyme [Rhodovulum iodosum]|uniref:Ribosomal protein S18 acetylase RimI-like enzyme n=1 Tax=Rhodovulum iodosum TaxID=68291 RepID=A0ABV3XW30_9RHOB|nr:GNAT family N-acetyltransferase [Rhodovulum robiginosum]